MSSRPRSALTGTLPPARPAPLTSSSSGPGQRVRVALPYSAPARYDAVRRVPLTLRTASLARSGTASLQAALPSLRELLKLIDPAGGFQSTVPDTSIPLRRRPFASPSATNRSWRDTRRGPIATMAASPELAGAFTVSATLIVLAAAGFAGHVLGRRVFANLGVERHERVILAVLGAAALAALASSVL